MAARVAALAAVYILLRTCAAVDEVSPATCMVQRKAAQLQGSSKVKKRPLKPWEMHNYVATGHHKGGVIMMFEIFRGIWTALGYGEKQYGVWIVPCYYPTLCYGWKKPVRYLMDFYSKDSLAEDIQKAGSRGLRVAGTVRNPLSMIASAYCYHHRGQEEVNVMFLPAYALPSMGPEEGLPFVAERMMLLIENMTGIYEDNRSDTHRVVYETATSSSEGFDAEINRLLDFWLEGVEVSPEDRQAALDGARLADLNRHPMTTHNVGPFWNPQHSNDVECETTAMRAVFSMPGDLLAKYQSFAKRLGYPYTAEELLPQ